MTKGPEFVEAILKKDASNLQKIFELADGALWSPPDNADGYTILQEIYRLAKKQLTDEKRAEEELAALTKAAELAAAWTSVNVDRPRAFEPVMVMSKSRDLDVDWLEPVHSILGQTNYFSENIGPIEYWMPVEVFLKLAPEQSIDLWKTQITQAKIVSAAAKRRHDKNNLRQLKG